MTLFNLVDNVSNIPLGYMSPGTMDVIAELLRRGARVNAVDICRGRDTALLGAIAGGHRAGPGVLKRTRGSRWTLAAVAVLVLGLAIGCAPEPREQDLKEQFMTHAGEFRQMRLLLNERPRISSIDMGTSDVLVDSGNAWPEPLHGEDARIAKLRAMMRSAGVGLVANGKDSTYFRMWMSCCQLRGQEAKGIFFALRAADFGSRDKVVPSVDSVPRLKYFRRGISHLYSQLQRNWYVFFDSGD